MDRVVRVGVLGLRRGADLARLAQQAGMQVVAVCDRDDRRREAATALGLPDPGWNHPSGEPLDTRWIAWN